MKPVLLLLCFAYCAFGSSLTVSGLSSGGFMAVQYHVAHSSEVSGVGVVAGGPYWCGQFNIATALACGSTPSTISVPALISATSYAEVTLTIDSTSNLRGSKVWLYSGTKDTVVKQGCMKKLETYYTNYISKGDISVNFNIPSEHSMVTADFGNNCSTLGEPFINNCNFDGVGEMFHWLFSDLKGNKSWNKTNLQRFNQIKYTPLNVNPVTLSMDQHGYVYIPTGCQHSASCDVHLALHGCKQGLQYVNTTYVEHSGYLEWAEGNNIIVIFPQIVPSTVPYNPEGCWDWWGYTGSAYATKIAPQIVTLRNMVKGFSS